MPKEGYALSTPVCLGWKLGYPETSSVGGRLVVGSGALLRGKSDRLPFDPSPMAPKQSEPASGTQSTVENLTGKADNFVPTFSGKQAEYREFRKRCVSMLLRSDWQNDSRKRF